MDKYTTLEGKFFVDIVAPTKEELEKFYEETSGIKSSKSSQDSPRIFKRAIIKSTFDEEKYPIDSIWIMGESPGMKINFFGEELIEIQEKDLHARIN